MADPWRKCLKAIKDSMTSPQTSPEPSEGDLQKQLRGLAQHAIGAWIIKRAADRIDVLEADRGAWKQRCENHGWRQLMDRINELLADRDALKATNAKLESRNKQLGTALGTAQEAAMADSARQERDAKRIATLEAQVKELETELIDILESRHNCLILDGAFRDEAKARIAALEEALRAFMDTYHADASAQPPCLGDCWDKARKALEPQP